MRDGGVVWPIREGRRAEFLQMRHVLDLDDEKAVDTPRTQVDFVATEPA